MRRLALTKKSYQEEDMLSSLLLNNVLLGNIISSFLRMKILVDQDRILAWVIWHLISQLSLSLRREDSWVTFLLVASTTQTG